MTSIAWNAEGGSDGTATSTANSGGASGTAWDTCQRGTNATNEYDSATAGVGALSVLVATGVTSTTAYNRWNGALTALWASGLTTHYGRFYIRVAALPGVDRTIVEFLDTTAATNRANIRLRTDGTIRLRNAASGTVATTTATVSVDTWYRLEYRIDGTTTGAYELHLYAGSSTTPIEDIVGGTANFGGSVGAVSYGYVSNAASLANLWFDGIQINDVGLPGPEASGQTVVIGQVTETDTAGTMGRLKASTVGQVSETDTAGAVGRLKALAIGQASETDTANAIGRLKTATIGQATETDTAGVIGSLKTNAVGQVTEADAAGAMARLKILGIGQVSETDTAQAVNRLKTLAVGQAVEVDTAQALSRLKTQTIGQASETDTAQAVSGRKVVAIGQATETDTALAVTQGNLRNLTVVLGPPQVKWRTGPPAVKWRTERPVLKWRIGSPRT